jgi:hypothetical protein
MVETQRIVEWLQRPVRIPSVGPGNAGPRSGAITKVESQRRQRPGLRRLAVKSRVRGPNTYGVRRGQTDRWIAVDVHVGTVGVETMIDSTSPGETPRPHPEAAVTAGIKVDSARPPATKIDLSTTPRASKNSVRKTVAKSGKATAGAAAEAPKQPLSPVQPEKTVKLPTAQAATDPVAAAPTTPTTFAAQSVGQLTHALVYLTRFPVALIQHATDPNTEGQ